MIQKLIREKMKEYNPQNALEQENVIQEILQHFVLGSLAKTNFFTQAMFHGGTCLKFFFSLNRFSEDLDFCTKKTMPHFAWDSFAKQIQNDCETFSLHLDIQDKKESTTAVKKIFLKTDSIGKTLVFDLPFERHQHKKFRIKLEIDTNPPLGSLFETQYIHFPTLAPITIQTLDCSFSLKSHALLCRTYIKGRDWFDFIWYVQKKIIPDLPLLRNAMLQQGVWANDATQNFDAKWYLAELKNRITSIDWKKAKDDIQRFIPQSEQEGLNLWSKDFFLHHLDRLKETMNEKS